LRRRDATLVLLFERGDFSADGRCATTLACRSVESVLFGPIYFLSGDAYPADTHVDRELEWRLSPSFAGWTGQKDIHDVGPDSFAISDFARRAAHLETYLASRSRLDSLILMGRSSGARLATWYASRHSVSAVVCLGYPFRNPELGHQPERYEHLAGMTTPTLIIQGFDDVYGGANIFSDYALSTSIRIHLVRTNHDFHPPPDSWDTIGRLILEFCQEVLPRP
jgi:hypothetical protein